MDWLTDLAPPPNPQVSQSICPLNAEREAGEIHLP